MMFSSNTLTNLRYNGLVLVQKVLRWPYERVSKAIASMEHHTYGVTDFEIVHRFKLGDKK